MLYLIKIEYDKKIIKTGDDANAFINFMLKIRANYKNGPCGLEELSKGVNVLENYNMGLG